MYDADYAEWLASEESSNGSADYVTRDSGKRAEHSDGVVRDTEEGKTRYTLMFPEGVPMKDQLIVRVAELYTRGGEKYGDRNWENSSSQDTLKHHTEALWRHFMSFFFGVEDGEDHAAAVVWNVNAVDLTRRKIALKAAGKIVKTAACEEQDDDVKSYVFPYIGKDTTSTGNYYQREVRAGSYQEAKMLFDNWQATQPVYSGTPPVPATPAPEDLEWAEGDVLEERKTSMDGRPYCWAYQERTGTWMYKSRSGEKPNPESARSLRKLIEEFGSLTCTKGSHTGRIVGGS